MHSSGIDQLISMKAAAEPAAIPISHFHWVSIHILHGTHNKHSSINVKPYFVIAAQPCGRLLQISISQRPARSMCFHCLYIHVRLFPVNFLPRLQNTKHTRCAAITTEAISTFDTS